MARVNTVLGTIPAAELGFVAIHEHIGYGMNRVMKKLCQSCALFMKITSNGARQRLLRRQVFATGEMLIITNRYQQKRVCI